MQHTEKRIALAQKPCRDRSDGLLCGDVWLALTTRGKRIVKRTCYVHGHVRRNARVYAGRSADANA